MFFAALPKENTPNFNPQPSQNPIIELFLLADHIVSFFWFTGQLIHNLFKNEQPDYAETSLPGGDLLVGPQKQLGEGGVGAVYEYQLNSTPVAVKLPKTFKQNRHQQHELEILKRVQPHNHIIHYVTEVEIEGKIGIVMELMQGSVFDLLDKKAHTLSWQTRLSIAIQMTRGLCYLHSSTPGKPSVIHHDIKVENLLVNRLEDDPEGIIVKITDFGFAQLAESELPKSCNASSSNIKAAGTAIYMAPETARKKGSTPKSDMFSAGLALWEIATFCSVVRGTAEIVSGTFATFENEKDPRTAAPSYQFSTFFGPAINRCIQKNPQDRCSAEELQEELHALSF